ncbi:hypothetical protein QFC22_000496 [Naganishia vaughanmartiniae]|uniref:Uncharacterized protein n=1 Tax=Naganishia vaughanmartiniae TaxID=1424756 RepID=A0ACC2XQ99_9TREE|nr:hypothetical protein QFC22_000496 [Naganishia vaughanmartiniae]
MHFSITQLVTVVAGLAASTTSAHSIHRRGAQHQHKDIAERLAANAPEGDAANFYARALSDAQAGKFRIRRSADSAGKPGQRKVVRKRGNGATCKIRSTANATEAAVESAASSSWSAEATASASASAAVNNWWASPSEAASSSAAPTSTWAAPSAESSAWVESTSSSSYYSESSSSAAPAATQPSTSTGHGTSIDQVTNNVLLYKDDGPCGSNNPTPEFPNGSEDWLNCGMKSPGGWSPPRLTFDDIRVGDGKKLRDMYPLCSQYFNLFSQVSAETSVPAQLLLSIAIQESGCRKDVRGGGGEMGLMQAAENRCPGGNVDSCMQPYNNIKLGADIFNEKLSAAGGNVLLALGAYNGWFEGMTFDEAHNATPCSHNKNRDYVHAIINGYMQGKDASNWADWGRNGC